MVIVGGTFEFEPDQREAFLVAQHETMRKSRSEPGCLEYTFSADPLDPGRVLLFERWVDQESVDTHLAGLRDAPPSPGPSVVPKAASIVLYDVAAERPLGG